jgi:phospholipid N-methyltransferase
MSRADAPRFLRAMLRHPAQVGALAPSSPALARAMVSGIDFSDGRGVLELGPGTGPFTKQIHQRLPDPSLYLGIERDPSFVRLLRERFPPMPVVEGSADRALEHLREAGIERIGAIISGLPFASLPPRVQDGVIRCLDQLMQEGTEFRTFQYLHAWSLPTAARFRRLMAERFGPCEVSRPVLRNLPPALVLRWRG